MRLVGERELEDIALGASILGTGGGGDPYVGMLLARAAIAECGPVQVVRIDEVPADALILPGAMMGAPTVLVEKLPSGDEVVGAFKALQRLLGERADYTMALEIGGINSVIPLCLAARAGVPLVDADFMGRAFPELQMCMPGLYGIGASPVALADEKGNTAVVSTIDNLWAERLCRTATIDMGCASYISLYSLRGSDLEQCTIAGSLSAAEDLGRLVRETRAVHGDPIAAVMERLKGFDLFHGKVIDVHRRTEGGFARSNVLIAGVDDHDGTSLTLQTQNEHLVAERDGEVLASVPDLIMVLDAENGQPITTEELRYGFRVVVIAAPCDPRWRSEIGLQTVGPRYFGYDFDYVPIEERAAAAGVG